MEFDEVVRKRRMVRHFTPEPVAKEVIDRILQQTRHVPSAGFSQGQSLKRGHKSDDEYLHYENW